MALQKVFIAYSKQDRDICDGFARHLQIATETRARIWRDTQIDGGDDWSLEISWNLRHADVGIVLVSENSMSEDSFVKQREVPELIRLRHRRDMLVVPVKISPVTLPEDHPIEQLQYKPDPSYLPSSERELEFKGWCNVAAQEVSRAILERNFVPKHVEKVAAEILNLRMKVDTFQRSDQRDAVGDGVSLSLNKMIAGIDAALGAPYADFWYLLNTHASNWGVFVSDQLVGTSAFESATEIYKDLVALESLVKDEDYPWPPGRESANDRPKTERNEIIPDLERMERSAERLSLRSQKLENIRSDLAKDISGEFQRSADMSRALLSANKVDVAGLNYAGDDVHSLANCVRHEIGFMSEVSDVARSDLADIAAVCDAAEKMAATSIPVEWSKEVAAEDFYIVSYSQNDARQVEPIIHFLLQNGIPLWLAQPDGVHVDPEQLTGSFEPTLNRARSYESAMMSAKGEILFPSRAYYDSGDSLKRQKLASRRIRENSGFQVFKVIPSPQSFSGLADDPEMFARIFVAKNEDGFFLPKRSISDAARFVEILKRNLRQFKRGRDGKTAPSSPITDLELPLQDQKMRPYFPEIPETLDLLNQANKPPVIIAFTAMNEQRFEFAESLVDWIQRMPVRPSELNIDGSSRLVIQAPLPSVQPFRNAGWTHTFASTLSQSIMLESTPQPVLDFKMGREVYSQEVNFARNKLSQSIAQQRHTFFVSSGYMIPVGRKPSTAVSDAMAQVEAWLALWNSLDWALLTQNESIPIVPILEIGVDSEFIDRRPGFFRGRTIGEILQKELSTLADSFTDHGSISALLQFLFLPHPTTENHE